MFKLINFFNCPNFNILRTDMEAPLAKNFKLDTNIKLLDEELIRKLGREGIDLEFEEIIPQEDNTLSYNGQRVLVYIRDVTNYKNKIDYLPKFHLAYCKTLENMRQNKRFERYVVSNREDGYFQINLNNNGWKCTSEKLNVCQNCLSTLKWENFTSNHPNKQRIISEFSIELFFKKYPKTLFSVKPSFTSDTAPLNDYTDDWPFISEELKRKRNYTCDGCYKVLIGEGKRYLHTHHLDGQKFNNNESNLQILCIKCHANEHSHMNNTSDHKKFIEIYG